MSAAWSTPRGLPALPEVCCRRVMRPAWLRPTEVQDRRRGGFSAASEGGERGVFDIVPTVHTTIEDVRDAVEACSPCDSADSRRSCFVIFGLDSDKVDKYQWAVEMLLRCMKRKGTGEEDEKGDWLRAPSGP